MKKGEIVTMLKNLISTVIVGLLLTFSLAPINGQELYNYQVTIYAGSYGIFNSVDAIMLDTSDTNSTPQVTLSDDQKQIVVTDLKANDRIGIQTNQITITNDKYYAKGIKTGGRDNENAYIYQWYTVTKDNNYVVAYGIPGNQVEYTTYYVDQAGNQLRQPETYYGTIGEYTIAGYKYVDGYLPQAYNLGQTLADDPSENIYTFVYSPVPALTVETGTIAVIPDTTTPSSATSSTTDSTTDQSTTVTTDDNEEISGDLAEGQESTTTGDETTEPEEFIDIDEQQTPLARNENQENTTTSQILTYTGIGAGILVIIGLVVYFYRRRANNNG